MNYGSWSGFATVSENIGHNGSSAAPMYQQPEVLGGKFLTFHGMEDYIISSEISTMFYHRLAETMSLPPSSLGSFNRYFRVNGMGHYAPGTGAYSLGMYSFGFSENTMEQDPDDNVLGRIVAWVEHGEAPEYIRGSSLPTGLPGSAPR